MEIYKKQFDELINSNYEQTCSFYNNITSISYYTNEKEQYEWTKYICNPYYSFTNENKFEPDFNVYCVNNTGAYFSVFEIYNNNSMKEQEINYRGEEIRIKKKDDSFEMQKYKCHDVIVVMINKKDIIYVHKEECLFAKYDLARVIREVFTRMYEINGYFVFHASSISYKNKGVLVCGRKQAGKTTSMIGFLEHFKDVKYIANDRVYVGKKNNNYLVSGWPIAAAVRYGTCYNSVKMRTWIDNNDKIYLSDIKKYLNAEIGKKTTEEKWLIKEFLEFTPLELSKIYNVDICSSAVINVILFPKLNPEIFEAKVTNVSREEIIEILTIESHSPDDSSYPDRFSFIKSEKEITDSVKKIIESIADEIGCYKIEYSNFKSLIEFIEREL